MERQYFYKGTNLIKMNAFWKDFAEHILKYGLSELFLSENFIHANGSTTEMIAVMALM